MEWLHRTAEEQKLTGRPVGHTRQWPRFRVGQLPFRHPLLGLPKPDRRVRGQETSTQSDLVPPPQNATLAALRGCPPCQRLLPRATARPRRQRACSIFLKEHRCTRVVEQIRVPSRSSRGPLSQDKIWL